MNLKIILLILMILLVCNNVFAIGGALSREEETRQQEDIQRVQQSGCKPPIDWANNHSCNLQIYDHSLNKYKCNLDILTVDCNGNIISLYHPEDPAWLYVFYLIIGLLMIIMLSIGAWYSFGGR